MDETNKKNKRTKISHKIATLIILFALILTAATTTVGYFVFKSNTERVYNDSAYNTAKVAASYISPELLKEYSDLAKEYVAGNVSQEQILSVIGSDDYKNVRALIVNLKEDMGANDIYIVYPDMEMMWNYGNIPDEEWNPMLYIFDSYIDENYSYYLGNIGPFNPKFIEDIDKVITTGERSDNYFVSKSKYGYNTSAVYPIYLNNELVGVVGTEIPMVTITDTLRKYLIIVTLLALAIMALVITLISMVLNKIIVKPINIVASEAEKFVDDTSVISMKLNSIRTNDEIEDLSQSIMTMENDINRYIAEVKSVTAEKERIGAELNIATNIQKSMLPIIFPAFAERKEFDIYTSMDPAK